MIWTAISLALCALTLWAARRDYLAARAYDERGRKAYDDAIEARRRSVAMFEESIEREKRVQRMCEEQSAQLQEWTA